MRIINCEALLLDRIYEINSRTHQVWITHLVYNNFYRTKFASDIAFLIALIEVELVTKTRASTWLHCNAQVKVIATFLSEEGGHLGGGNIGKRDRC